MGEGAAFVVLESLERARSRGARLHGVVSGDGVSNDAHHIGMPATEGQVRSLRAALDDAGLQSSDIGYVNAHATATDGGDVIEAAALREVFGAGPTDPPVSSTKSVAGAGGHAGGDARVAAAGQRAHRRSRPALRAQPCRPAPARRAVDRPCAFLFLRIRRHQRGAGRVPQPLIALKRSTGATP